MASEIEESESPPSQSQCADPLQSQSAAKSNKLYVFFWHVYSPVMYSLYEIEVPKPLPPPPSKATQANEIKKPKKLSTILQLKTGEYPDGMSCISLGSKLYFFGGEFNIDNPYIDEDAKKKFENVKRDVFPRQVLIFDLSKVGASGDELHKLLVYGTPMRSGKARPQAFVAEKKIYVIGSSIQTSISHRSKLTNLDLNSFRYFEVYDPGVCEWNVLPDPPIGNVKTRWVGHAIVRRKALLVAWQGGKERLYCFDLIKGQWTAYASVPSYPDNFSGRTEFVEDTLYGCYHGTIAAIAPVVREEENKVEKVEKEEAEKEEKKEKVEAEEGEKMEEEKVEAEEEEEEAKEFGQGGRLFKCARLLKHHCLHLLSEEMGMDAIFNVPPQLQSSSSLLHLGNRYFCYVKSGMPPNPDYGSDDVIQDDKIRFISIVIFQALGKTYEEDATRLFRAQFLHSAHYVINSLVPNEGFINGCFFPGSMFDLQLYPTPNSYLDLENIKVPLPSASSPLENLVLVYSAFKDVGLCLWNFLSSPLDEVRNLEDNLDSLKAAMEQLKIIYEDLKHRVDEEEPQMKRTNQVSGWLEQVLKLENDVSKILKEDEEQDQIKCLGGFCPKNYLSRYKFGEIVSEKLEEVEELKRAGQFNAVVQKGHDPVQKIPTVENVSLCDASEEDRISLIAFYKPLGFLMILLGALVRLHIEALSISPVEINFLTYLRLMLVLLPFGIIFVLIYFQSRNPIHTHTHTNTHTLLDPASWAYRILPYELVLGLLMPPLWWFMLNLCTILIVGIPCRWHQPIYQFVCQSLNWLQEVFEKVCLAAYDACYD